MDSEMTLDKYQKVIDFAKSLVDEPQISLCDEHYDAFLDFLGDNPDLDYDTCYPIFIAAYLSPIPDDNSDKATQPPVIPRD